MISKEALLTLLDDGGTFRKQFSAHSGVQKNKSSPTFSVPFDNGLVRHFLVGTGMTLKWGAAHSQFYCFLRDAEAVEAAERWEAAQGTRVFLRNLMTSSVALDINFEDNTSGRRTYIGALEEKAKYHGDVGAITELASISAETVGSISYLQKSPYVLGIPAMPDKEFDLPRVLSDQVSSLTKKIDITGSFTLKGKEKSAKAVELLEKWDVWDKCSFDYAGPNLNGQSVILIDDKYQAGVTMQFWASKLMALGAREVHGLSMVKTLRDTDNV